MQRGEQWSPLFPRSPDNLHPIKIFVRVSGQGEGGSYCMSESVHVFVLRSAHWVDTGGLLLRVGVCPMPTLPSVPSHIPPNGPKLPVGGKTSVQRINKIMGRAAPCRSLSLLR